MKRLLQISAVGEVLTGLGLVVAPPLITKLIFGSAVEGMGTVVTRLAGLALISLGLACWPSDTGKSPRLGLLFYNLAAAVYLAIVGIGGESVGVLLWPAVAIHAVISMLLIWGCFGGSRKS